jgi:tRNA(fMet)-specific endonuclease VapC
VLAILDTDVVSLLQAESSAVQILNDRLEQHGMGNVATTIITFQEQVKGRLGQVNAARKPDQLLRAYLELTRLVEYYRQAKVLPFGPDALDRFETLKRTVRGPGTLDLRIAAIVLAHGGILISRNLRDFKKVPGLVVEDWTSEPPGGEAAP